jgi:hypothetical protein
MTWIKIFVILTACHHTNLELEFLLNDAQLLLYHRNSASSNPAWGSITLTNYFEAYLRFSIILPVELHILTVRPVSIPVEFRKIHFNIIFHFTFLSPEQLLNNSVDFGVLVIISWSLVTSQVFTQCHNQEDHILFIVVEISNFMLNHKFPFNYLSIPCFT